MRPRLLASEEGEMVGVIFSLRSPNLNLGDSFER